MCQSSNIPLCQIVLALAPSDDFFFQFSNLTRPVNNYFCLKNTVKKLYSLSVAWKKSIMSITYFGRIDKCILFISRLKIHVISSLLLQVKVLSNTNKLAWGDRPKKKSVLIFLKVGTYVWYLTVKFFCSCEIFGLCLSFWENLNFSVFTSDLFL